jgi:hypothetical protein
MTSAKNRGADLDARGSALLINSCAPVLAHSLGEVVGDRG